MKRIAKIIKKVNFIPEFGYLIITTAGLVVYNGKIGIKYSREVTGERLCLIADQIGDYAIPEAFKFLKSLGVLEKISSVTKPPKKSLIEIKFGTDGIIQIPIITELSKDLPHLLIDWQEYDNATGTGTDVTSLWREIAELTTNEGEALWGDVIGAYGKDGALVSFDYGVYLHSDKIGEFEDFFCPRSLLELGLNNMEYAIVKDKSIFIVGTGVQYVCTGVSSSKVLDDMVKLKEDYSRGEIKKVTLDFTSGLWKRAKLFSDTSLTLAIVDNEVHVGNDNWSEKIGVAEIPDVELTTRLSLLERWVSGTFNHAVSIMEDGNWNLHGKTRGGLYFNAVLTGAPTVENTQDEEVEQLRDRPINEEVDLDAGETLL